MKTSGLRDGLGWLLVLAREQNMTVAAAELGIAQPTLSRMLSRLESRLGQRIFDRPGRRLVLNPAGARLIAHVRRADAELAAAEQELRAAPPVPLRLGFLHSFGTWLVPRLITDLGLGGPDAPIELSQGAADLVVEQLRSGRSDVAVTSPRPPTTELVWRQLMRQQLWLAVPADHPLAGLDGRRSVRLATVGEQPFLSMPHGFGMRSILDNLCAAAGFTPRITVESQELTTVAALVGAGLGIAVLPAEDVAAVPPGVRLLPLAGSDDYREIGLVWRPDPLPHVREFTERAVRSCAGWVSPAVR
ncbi:LysR family transcriptional regulator [Nakamurella aerolata]|uniref:LysR family transcriptional regulator n=1 Tax=Nakamurella aerolata TaxID=1656892 RepID=A0A849ACF7_9ACTN|nr:LysR family transcriptional regulator [Nakamurella aerolata]NNG37597.1 LysR family transcriptional regulator [Nakamurella aerolata]